MLTARQHSSLVFCWIARAGVDSARKCFALFVSLRNIQMFALEIKTEMYFSAIAAFNFKTLVDYSCGRGRSC